MTGSVLIDTLAEKLTEESGQACEITALGAAGVKSAMDGGLSGECLIMQGDDSTSAYISENGLGGGEFCFDALVMVAPVEDKTGVWQLNDVSGADVLKHIALTKSNFVHAPADTPLGRVEQQMWQQAGITPEGDWYIAAASEGIEILNEAQANSAYALVDRHSMAMVGNEYESLKIVKINLDGMALRYFAMAEPAAEGAEDNATQAFAKWLFGDNAKALIAQYNMMGEEPEFSPGMASDYNPEQPTPTPAPTPEPTQPPASTEPEASPSGETPPSEAPASPEASAEQPPASASPAGE